MKRDLLAAAALLMIAGQAFSQSNVTVYGILDTGVMYQSKTAGGAGSGFILLDGSLSPSIYGFRGTEDLGGGLKASFNLEGGFSTDTGTFGNSSGGIFGRAANIELSGGFGSLKAGLQFSPFFLTLIASEPRGMAQFGSQLIPYLNEFGITGMFERNALVYTTPNLNGLSASAEYAFGEVAGDNSRGRHVSASVSYTGSSFLVNSAYFRANDTATGGVDAKGWTVGGGVTFGDLATKIAYTRYERPALGTNPVKVISVGASYPLTPALVVNGGIYSIRETGSSNSKAMLYGFGATYSLSKRTSLYTQLGIADNEGSMQIGLAANAQPSFAVPTGTTTSALNIGVRHTF